MKKVILIIFALVAIPAVLFLFKILNPPANFLTGEQKTQALTNILGRKPNLSDSTPKGNKTYKDKFVSFSYPASARIYNYREPNIASDSSVLAVFSFDISNPRLIFYYSVIKYLPSNVSKVSDIPDVRLRQLQSNLYSQTLAFADNREGLLFQKQEENGKIEKSAFFYLNEKEYSFSIQGSDQKGVDNLYNQVVDSLKFLP